MANEINGSGYAESKDFKSGVINETAHSQGASSIEECGHGRALLPREVLIFLGLEVPAAESLSMQMENAHINDLDYGDLSYSTERLVPQTGHTPSDIRALITQVVRNQEGIRSSLR